MLGVLLPQFRLGWCARGDHLTTPAQGLGARSSYLASRLAGRPGGLSPSVLEVFLPQVRPSVGGGLVFLPPQPRKQKRSPYPEWWAQCAEVILPRRHPGSSYPGWPVWVSLPRVDRCKGMRSSYLSSVCVKWWLGAESSYHPAQGLGTRSSYLASQLADWPCGSLTHRCLGSSYLSSCWVGVLGVIILPPQPRGWVRGRPTSHPGWPVGQAGYPHQCLRSSYPRSVHRWVGGLVSPPQPRFWVRGHRFR